MTTGLDEKVLILQFPEVTLGDSCMLCQRIAAIKYYQVKGQACPLSNMTGAKVGAERGYRQLPYDIQQPHAGPRGERNLMDQKRQICDLKIDYMG